MTRNQARQQILDAVNTCILGLGYSSRRYTMRTIQRAVCIARRRKLVAPEVLREAGFNA